MEVVPEWSGKGKTTVAPLIFLISHSSFLTHKLEKEKGKTTVAPLVFLLPHDGMK